MTFLSMKRLKTIQKVLCTFVISTYCSKNKPQNPPAKKTQQEDNYLKTPYNYRSIKEKMNPGTL